jgi:hypothetical protein
VAASDLIDGQYADRPELRPVMEAVLAVLPQIGEVTVQARNTLISLVSPKRVFAVLQAPTRSRVDLGLRLDGQPPGGRLLPARDLGMANLRLTLTERACTRHTSPGSPCRPVRPGRRPPHRSRKLRQSASISS